MKQNILKELHDPSLSNEHQICSRCIYDERVSGIHFDQNGVCNYCHQIDELISDYGTGLSKGIKEFEAILDKVKARGKNKKYDCVIGVSGGTDSCYMVHMAVKEWGLRPLAVHYDNTWNSSIATINIAKVLEPLGVDLYTKVVNNLEINDIVRSFFRAGVAELDSPTDLAYAETLNRAAWKLYIQVLK